MTENVSELGLIAGRGAYPLLLAESARLAGVRRLVVVAFRGETERRIGTLADEVHWIRVGELARMLDTLERAGIRHAVMAGQIRPTNLFRVRLDADMRELLRALPRWNAETIFGAVGDRLLARGIALLPAFRFVEPAMPQPGLLTARPPTAEECRDIRLGLRVATATSSLDIGQTVVVKNGTILAVEAFEGTDPAIRRAGKLGGAGCVVVKVAKPGHDMRFDIPVIGLRTLRSLRAVRGTAIAVEARRTLVLERDALVRRADRAGICIVSVDPASPEWTWRET